jgi:glucan 1,3-beta-glucosidase
MLAHLTPSSSAYIDNMWGKFTFHADYGSRVRVLTRLIGWTADHDLDSGNDQNIAVGRGILIEATKGTWLLGLAFGRFFSMAQSSIDALLTSGCLQNTTSCTK